MSIEAEAVARRYAHRPGCRFVGYKAVGVAVFSMNLRALAIEPRKVPPIDEFVLRLMAEGIDSLPSLAGLLGLEPEMVRTRLIELRRQECIDVVAGASSTRKDIEPSTFVLTARGRELATSLHQNVMQEITIPNVIFHGLLRTPVQIGDISRRQYLRPRDAKDAGLTLIRAIPNRYPHPEEIDIDALDRVVKNQARPKHGEARRDIVAVKNVLKMVYTLYEPAVMLEYDTDDAKGERQVAFVIEGQLREEYETAFADARGPELLSEVLSPKSESLQGRLERVVPKTLIRKLGPLDDVEELATRYATAEQEVEDAKRECEESDRADTRQVLRDRVAELEKEKAEIQRVRDSRRVKFLWTPEIREKLWEALETSESRLLILSGFISSDVVDEDFEDALNRALRRGVRVWIGYGFDKGNRRGEEQRGRRSWREAEARFSRLKKAYPEHFTYQDVGRSHEKRLICDNKFTFGGSFNLLSFSGETRGSEKKLRHEGADLIADADFCEELYTRYLRMFF